MFIKTDCKCTTILEFILFKLTEFQNKLTVLIIQCDSYWSNNLLRKQSCKSRVLRLCIKTRNVCQLVSFCCLLNKWDNDQKQYRCWDLMCLDIYVLNSCSLLYDMIITWIKSLNVWDIIVMLALFRLNEEVFNFKSKL